MKIRRSMLIIQIDKLESCENSIGINYESMLKLTQKRSETYDPNKV